MKQRWRDYLLLLLISGIIITLDQVTKEWVRNSIPMNGTWMPWEWLAPYMRIVHWSNTGAAFGIFQGSGTVLAILAVIVCAAIIYYFPQVPRSDWTLRLAMGMQLGGAIGNLIDRIREGHVTDFISVGNFAVFNVADSAITVGVGVLILGVIIQEIKARKQKNMPLPPEDIETIGEVE